MAETMLQGVNGNTLVYIVNALNGEVKRVNTLVKEVAKYANEGLSSLTIDLERVEELYGALVELTDTEFATRLTKAILKTYKVGGTYTDNNGNIVEVGGEDSIITELDEISSSLRQTADNITAMFTSRDASIETLNSTTGNLTITTTELKSYIQSDINGITLGRSDSPVKLKIMNDGIYIVNTTDDTEEKITYWNTQEQRTPKSLIVPTGGNFSMGNFRFVPRSSGNLSIVKV